MSKISRRDFMKSTMAAGAAMALLSPNSRIRGANENLRVAVVGTGGQGSNHVKYFSEKIGRAHV